MAHSQQDVADAARELISQSRRRLTPEQIHQHLMRVCGSDRRTAMKALNALIQSGDLQYTYEFGCSFVVPSYNRPVAVSERVVLKPQGHRTEAAGGQVVLTLRHGASFGTGAHPTTRLAIRGVEAVVTGTAGRVLDIGTGSGVLLLTALALGMTSGVGLDLDPCAVAEAKTNARLNNMGDRTRFTDLNLDRLPSKFDLITANLRFPTLCELAETLVHRLASGGRLVVSGVLQEESEPLAANYREHGWESMWQETDTGWAGHVFKRQAP